MYSLYHCNLTPHFLLDFLFKKLHFLFLFEDGDLEADLAASMAGSTVSRNLLRQAMSADNFNGHFKKFVGNLCDAKNYFILIYIILLKYLRLTCRVDS